MTRLVASLTALLALLCAVPAHAESDEHTVERASAAEYFVGLLEEEPEGAAVVVHDSVAGDSDPDELEQDLHDSFGRLDVPYHVVAGAVPGDGGHGEDFLAAVQDRMGEPGLYVLLRPRQTQVYVTSSGVDLPVEDASRALLRERTLTYETPMAVRAEAFVDALRDPNLAERVRVPWYQTSPIFWWLDPYVQGLRLTTHDGPTKLGGATAFVLALTLTLGAALARERVGRRKRAEAVGHTGRLPGDRALVMGSVLIPAVGVVVMAASLLHLNTATLPRDTQEPGPIPPETAPYVASTIRVDRIVEGLRNEPLYLDPLAQNGPGELVEVAERVEDAELPVYAAVLPMNNSDESGGEPEILAHALHHVLGEDGVYVVVDDSGESPRVGAALFGVSHGDEWDTRNAQRDVISFREGLTTAQALDEYLDTLVGASPAPGENSPPPYSVERRANPSPEPSRWSEYFSEDFYLALLLVGPLTALALLWTIRGAVNASRPWRAAPGRALRPRADRAVRRATKALHAASDDHPGRSGALREVDAALAVLNGDPDELDLVGVTVLADRATRRLDPDPDTAATADRPVCGVNPLHGPAVTKDTDSARHLCAACAALPSSARSRATLRVTAPSGGRRPHHELDRRWVTTGYGATGPLDVEQLLKESDVH